MTMYKDLPQRNDVDWLYVKRNEGGSGFDMIEDCVDVAIHEIKGHTWKTRKN